MSEVVVPRYVCKHELVISDYWESICTSTKGGLVERFGFDASNDDWMNGLRIKRRGGVSYALVPRFCPQCVEFVNDYFSKNIFEYPDEFERTWEFLRRRLRRLNNKRVDNRPQLPQGTIFQHERVDSQQQGFDYDDSVTSSDYEDHDDDLCKPVVRGLPKQEEVAVLQNFSREIPTRYVDTPRFRQPSRKEFDLDWCMRAAESIEEAENENEDEDNVFREPLIGEPVTTSTTHNDFLYKNVPGNAPPNYDPDYEFHKKMAERIKRSSYEGGHETAFLNPAFFAPGMIAQTHLNEDAAPHNFEHNLRRKTAESPYTTNCQGCFEDTPWGPVVRKLKTPTPSQLHENPDNDQDSMGDISTLNLNE